MLGPALAALIGTQAAVVAATLTVPVLAPDIAAELGMVPAILGYHTASVFAFAFVFAQVSATLVRRFGPIGVSMVTAGMAAAALAAVVFGGVPGLLVSTPLLGAAYAQGNTASGALLSRLVTARNRNLVFSIKQTSVPVGAAVAGLLLPNVALRSDWQAAVIILLALVLAITVACAPWRRRLDGLMSEEPGAGASRRPLDVLRHSPDVRRMAALAGCFASVQFGLAAMFVILLSARHGLGLAEAGAALTVAMALAVAARLGLGSLADLFSARVVLGGIGIFMAATSISLISVQSPVPAVIAATLLMTAAFSWNGVFLAETARCAPPGEVGPATAAAMSSVFLGGAVAPALFASLVATTGSYVPALALFVVSMTVAVALAFRPAKARVF